MSADAGREIGTLAHFQDDFARALFAPETGSYPLARQAGFAVYRNTVMKGLIDALAANYPAVARLVGRDWFRSAAAIYARAHPPTHPSLLDYGAGFAQFLADFEPAADLPYLPGVAALDRFWTEAHTARDETPLATTALARLAPEQLDCLRLRPHASARWSWFEAQPTFSIWQGNREAAGCEEQAIDWQGQGALLLRPHDAVAWCELEQAGCVFLDACANGAMLAEAAAAAQATQAGVDLVALLARLLAAGAFAAIEVVEAAQ